MTAPTRLFGRFARVTVNTIQIANGSLDVAFKIKKSLVGGKPNDAEVRIWNLTEAHRLGLLYQMLRVQLTLVGEQPIVHLPVLASLAGAARRFRCLGGLRVNLLEREVTEGIAHLSGIHVILDQLRHGLLSMTLAERTLVI